jgi:acyl-CoA thioester hydrolase
MSELLAGFPVIIEIPVAWGEMDAFQHVNNVAYIRYLESGRIAYLERTGMMEEMAAQGVGPILASVSCKYRFPLTFPDLLLVGTRVGEISADRCILQHRVVSTRHRKVAAEGEGVIVCYDYREQRKVALSAAVRARIEAVEASAGQDQQGI